MFVNQRNGGFRIIKWEGFNYANEISIILVMINQISENKV